MSPISFPAEITSHWGHKTWGPGSSRVFIHEHRNPCGEDADRYRALECPGMDRTGVGAGTNQHAVLPDRDHPDKAAREQVTGTTS